MEPTGRRRALLATLAGVTLSGCTTGLPLSGESTDETGPPVADRELPRPYDLETLADAIVETGLQQDGIPSIDDPAFIEAADSSMDDGDPVFGVTRNGEARAYPQHILVHHEIVNDRIAGDTVAITYCPLTGTVQGFERGDTEFGVSGTLLNNNLVMYDRGSESAWPQMFARAVMGPFKGEYLNEFEMIWTTWGRWTATFPGTQVLSTDTGRVRPYGRDEYGRYNPRGGYYANDAIHYPVLAEEDTLHPKEVVIGLRDGDIGAVAIVKDHLRTEQLIVHSDDAGVAAIVHDDSLDTGYAYRISDETDITHNGENPVVDGTSYPPSDLPFERVISFDAMWFAWAAFYPSTALYS